MELAMSATQFVPSNTTLHGLRAAVQSCQGCELYRRATQAVFGQGQTTAEIMLVGEQPGDEEDMTGEPFVGPAGRWLHKALDEAGIPRANVYLTNVVKHFKWEERGVRRLHKKPSAREIKACEPWLRAEISVIEARVIVCLGASAAQTLLGSKFRITASRGAAMDLAGGRTAIATWHPAAVLRAPDAKRRATMHGELVADLRQALAISQNES